MKEHGYNIVLNKKINVSTKSASLVDLSPETIDMINRVYKNDFATFGYRMIH
jgi:hypothetical protein